MLHIKKATTEDIPLIKELTKQVWPQTYAPIVGDMQVAYMLDMMYSDESLQKQMTSGHQFIVCHSDDIAAGFASWSAAGERVYKVHKIYILPQYQGKGIGNHMIAHVAAESRKSGADILELNVNRYNYSAQAFYKRLGFSNYREEDIAIGNGYYMNDYILRLAL